MYVKTLRLLNFRNYRDVTVELDSDTVVFYGQNAQGKTNLLEAIYLCSCLRSHRTYRDSDLITHGESEYSVGLDFIETAEDNTEYSGFNENISVAYFDTVSKDASRMKPKRVLKHNGMLLSKTQDIVGIFNAVIFAPEDLNIIKDGPSIRRRYIDMLISQIKPSYFNELSIYQKTLLQRNSQLKRMRDGLVTSDHYNIEVWDMALASSAAKIIMTRNDFSIKINKHASNHHLIMSSGKEELNVKYRSVAGISTEDGYEEIQQSIYNKLKGNFNEDVERGSTTHGPHRDDLDISINNESIRSYASQGQQRTAVLSLKIAELEIIATETRSMPVLLLDDVMSELDQTRRKQLLSAIGRAQVILTCTDASHVEPELISMDGGRKIRYFEVSDGTISPSDMV